MYLVAGLGNPGLQYEQTRHNMGYWALDELAELWKLRFTGERFHGYLATGRVAGDAVALLKPTAFMNNSGQSLLAAMRHYKLLPQEIIVVYDDLDLPVGKIRVRVKGGPGTHNGMRSIVGDLGSEDFPRIRIGIGQPAQKGDLIDFVLGRPEGEERDLLKAAARKAAEAADAIVRLGLEPAMQRHNRG